jgi:hypothetical protein
MIKEQTIKQNWEEEKNINENNLTINNIKWLNKETSNIENMKRIEN